MVKNKIARIKYLSQIPPLLYASTLFVVTHNKHQRGTIAALKSRSSSTMLEIVIKQPRQPRSHPQDPSGVPNRIEHSLSERLQLSSCY